MNEIKLNLINRSNDQNNSEIVIFQKNVATDFDEIAVAWQVIKNLGQGWHHAFTYPLSYEVAAADADGNESPLRHAEEGENFHVIQTAHGHELKTSGLSEMTREMAIRNDLPMGRIHARIYKAGKLFASKTDVSPGQKAIFQFKPTIYLGIVSELEEGTAIDSAILSDINTEISLMGIKSADIVLTGGGSGPDATAFSFQLENVQMV
jgi:hypothetical protein